MLVPAGGYGDQRANAIAIRFRSCQLDAQAAVRPAFVMKQICAATIRGHQDIERAVVINICVSRAAADSGRSEGAAKSLRDFHELASAKIAEHVRRLGVTDTLLHFFNLIFDVAV